MEESRVTVVLYLFCIAYVKVRYSEEVSRSLLSRDLISSSRVFLMVIRKDSDRILPNHYGIPEVYADLFVFVS